MSENVALELPLKYLLTHQVYALWLQIPLPWEKDSGVHLILAFNDFVNFNWVIAQSPML